MINKINKNKTKQYLIASKLIKFQKENKLTDNEMAEKLHVRRSTWSGYKLDPDNFPLPAAHGAIYINFPWLINDLQESLIARVADEKC